MVGHLDWKRKDKEKANGKMEGVPQKWPVKERGLEGKWEEGRRKLAWHGVLAYGQVPPHLYTTPNLSPPPASPLCLHLRSPLSPETPTSNCAYLCLSTSLNNPSKNFGQQSVSVKSFLPSWQFLSSALADLASPASLDRRQWNDY